MTTNTHNNQSTRSSLAPQNDNYEPLEVIGSGTFGIIRKVRKISDGKFYARKELNFERMSDRDRKQIVAEVNILRNLTHDNVVKYEERWVDGDNGILYIVMEYCGGGDLGSIIKKCRKNNTLLSEDTIWTYLYQMVLALDVCHYRTNTSTSSPTSNPSPSSTTASYLEAQPPLNAILHRDLKPENVFLDSESNIKLGDFGLSKQLNSETFTNTYVGTPYYMSPELATGKSYDSKSDIWALGCIGYELGALSPPFDASNQAELTRKIKAGNVPQLPKGFSLELGSLIRQMLDLNPNRRPTTRQLLTHPQIIFAKRTLELTSLKRTLQNETIRLRDFSNSLNLKEAKLVEFERELKTREEMLSSRSNSNSNYDVQPLLSELREKEQELVERERLLREQEEILEKGNDDLDDRRADLERKWLNWRDGERLKKDEEMRKCLLERDAARNALEEHLKRSGSSSQKGESHHHHQPIQGQVVMEKKARRISCDPNSMPSSHHPIGSKRPVLTKRISSGSKATIPRSSNSNISINNSSSAMNLDQTDISMLHIRERVINGNTGFGTPKARRERELRNKEKLQKAGSRRISNSIDGEEAAEMEVESDEWIDNEAGSNEEGSNGRMDDDQVLRRSSAQEEKTARRSAGRVSTSHHSSSIRERSSRSNLKESTTIKISATTGRSSNASAPRSSAKYDLSNSSRSRRSSGITSNSYTSNGNGHLDVNPTMRPSSSNDRLTSNFTNHRDVSDSRDESDQSDVVMKTFIEDDSLSRTKSDEQESSKGFDRYEDQEEITGELSNETTSSDIRANDTFDQVLQDKENRRSRVARNDVQLERIPLPRKGREDTLNSKFSNLEVNKKELSPSKSASRLNSLTRRSDRDSSSNSSNTSKKISPSAKITASATGNLTRPALASRTTLPAVINQTALTEVPNYDLENDQDLPSPFLRKVNRLENEKFKPSSGGGLLARAAMNKAGLNAKSGIASSSSSTVGPSRVSMKAEKVGTVHSAPTSRIGSTSNSASRISSTQPIINRRQSTGTGILNTTPTLGSNASAIASGRISATSRPRISAVTSSTINREAPTRRR